MTMTLAEIIEKLTTERDAAREKWYNPTITILANNYNPAYWAGLQYGCNYALNLLKELEDDGK